jgi:hypothetical protein
MCEWGNTVSCIVKIPNFLSCTGKEYYREKQIDSCIASIIKDLNNLDIETISSCCGHNKGSIHIELAKENNQGVIIEGE